MKIKNLTWKKNNSAVVVSRQVFRVIQSEYLQIQKNLKTDIS